MLYLVTVLVVRTGIPPSSYVCGPWLLSLEKRRKLNQKKSLSSRLIPHILVVSTRQIETLVTTPVY